MYGAQSYRRATGRGNGVNGVIGRGFGLSTSERERRERALLGIVSSCTSRELWVGLKSRGAALYPDAYDSNRRDTRLVQTSHGFKTTDDRHFFLDCALHDMAKECGFVAFPDEVRINRWRYTLANFGRFTAIQKYTHSQKALPRAADFRKKLARAGGITEMDDLLLPKLASDAGVKIYHTILIHGPKSRDIRSADFRELGFMCLAFPYDNYSDWAAILDIDRLIGACQNQVNGVQPVAESSDNGPAPVWKERPERKD